MLDRTPRIACVLLLAVVYSGCMSSKITDGRKSFYEGDYTAAAESFAKIKDNEGGKDQALALLEYGMVQHVAGNYRESTDALLEAGRIIKKDDIIHLAESTGSLVSNEMVTTFKPESFEWVLVHTYLSMNFMLMDDWSAARVEAKRALKLLNSLDEELRDQPFTRYVCALAYEVMGDIDDAYIEYKKVAKITESVPVYRDLYRLALEKGSGDEQKWAKKIKKHAGQVPEEPKTPNLIMFINAGRGPIKQELNMVVPPHANRFVVPEYTSSHSLAHHAVLTIGEEHRKKSFTLTDLNPLAKLTLSKRIKKVIAKELARVLAKEVIASTLEDQSLVLGLGARVVFFASEAADVRSWETLPRYMGVIKYTLPTGTYDLNAQFYGKNGKSLDKIPLRGVTIREDRRTVLSVRSTL